MLKKIYEQLRLLLKENYKFLFSLLALYFVLTIPLPYYIQTTGGLINISDRVVIAHEYHKKGSINLSYVSEMRGNVLTCALSYVIPHWDLVKESDYVSSNETYDDADYRDHMLLDEANGNAMLVAYNAAGRKVTIKEQHLYVVYIDSKADTTFKIGDEILNVDGKKITSMTDYLNAVAASKVNDLLNVEVKDKNNKIVSRSALVYAYGKRQVTGILIATKYVYTADPKITFKFKTSESGPSGGLMMTLSIYDKLTTEDLTKGKIVVGTGTIDREGNVGQISGIEYKLKGAVDAHADIFFAPLGDNYNDAKSLAAKNHYNIKIVGVATFTDALNYLRSV